MFRYLLNPGLFIREGAAADGVLLWWKEDAPKLYAAHVGMVKAWQACIILSSLGLIWSAWWAVYFFGGVEDKFRLIMAPIMLILVGVNIWNLSKLTKAGWHWTVRWSARYDVQRYARNLEERGDCFKGPEDS